MRLVSGRVFDRARSTMTRDLCESLEVSHVHVGLETRRRYESRTKRKSVFFQCTFGVFSGGEEGDVGQGGRGQRPIFPLNAIFPLNSKMFETSLETVDAIS